MRLFPMFAPLLFLPALSHAEEAKAVLPLPRYELLHAKEVNMRHGPSQESAIDWVYARQGLPVKVLEEYQNWFKIRDPDGTEGWVQGAMLSKSRSMLVLNPDQAPAPHFVTLRSKPDGAAVPVARIEAGVVMSLLGCSGDWVNASTSDGFKGWLPRDAVWGIEGEADACK